MLTYLSNPAEQKQINKTVHAKAVLSYITCSSGDLFQASQLSQTKCTPHICSNMSKAPIAGLGFYATIKGQSALGHTF